MVGTIIHGNTIPYTKLPNSSIYTQVVRRRRYRIWCSFLQIKQTPFGQKLQNLFSYSLWDMAIVGTFNHKSEKLDFFFFSFHALEMKGTIKENETAYYDEVYKGVQPIMKQHLKQKQFGILVRSNVAVSVQSPFNEMTILLATRKPNSFDLIEDD